MPPKPIKPNKNKSDDLGKNTTLKAPINNQVMNDATADSSRAPFVQTNHNSDTITNIVVT
jgi:hypothetical protein